MTTANLDATMNCTDVRARLVAWQDRELSAGENFLVGRHLEGCRSCRKLEARLADATPRVVAMPDPKREAQLFARLDSALDAAARATSPVATGSTWRRAVTAEVRVPAGLVAMWAAALALAIAWGAHQTWGDETSKHTIAAVPTRPALQAGTVPTTVPSEQYRAASWSPPSADATTPQLDPKATLR